MGMPTKTEKEHLKDAVEIIRKQTVEIADYRRSINQLRKSRVTIGTAAPCQRQPPLALQMIPLHQSGLQTSPKGLQYVVHQSSCGVIFTMVR